MKKSCRTFFPPLRAHHLYITGNRFSMSTRQNNQKIITKNEKETFAFGAALARKLRGGDILLLYGELGAGKTALVKGIAAGLGVKEKITSPTFALMNVYLLPPPSKSPSGRPPHQKFWCGGRGTQKFVHIDTYRLKNEHELVEIGALDYLGRPDTICAIEWPEKIKELLKNIGQGPKIITVRIEYAGGNKRKIHILPPLSSLPKQVRDRL
ncbi:tRNA (adenosine(37)-N6)-threonylcarbamoyltransferase complex ATPase subunit type 1 TsaE [Patescibacteria group bacterium]|nr:MAG: tRNA (adenosine(37)-N6)-threonylcarbamoyltransferase complex ATPase subunit type 1 TsaE [Patescibacteria group bacterium]